MRFRKISFPHSQFLGNENKGIDLEATESRKEESSIDAGDALVEISSQLSAREWGMYIRQKHQNERKKLVENAWQKVEVVVVYASRLRDTHRDSKTGRILGFRITCVNIY